ncbi:rust resistance kinase Lr10 [Rosa sericea]
MWIYGQLIIKQKEIGCMIHKEIPQEKMDILLLLCFLLVLVPNTKAANHHVHQDCPISRCSDDGPLIQFPFRRKGDPLHCGNPEFEVSCSTRNNTNMTMIQLSSSSGLFPVKKIDYANRFFDVSDDDGCLPRRLLNLTVSSTSLFTPVPYRWSRLIRPYYRQRNYNTCAKYYPFIPSRPGYFGSSPKFKEFTLLNCSTTQNFSTGSYYMPVICLSVPGHHQVLAVEPTISIDDLPVSTCSTLKTRFHLPVRSVYAGSYECSVDNVLLLEWETPYYFPECQNCKGSCGMDRSSNRMECIPYPAYVYPPQMPNGHSSVIVAVSIACFVLISAMVMVAILYYVKKSDRIEEKENQIKIEKFLDDHKSHVPTRYSYADIKKMTNGFRKKLGEGGFGSVFSGKLPSNGVPVAIKVLKDSKGNGDDFVNEVGTIGRIHHVNVVRLLGFSAEGGKRALIYEDMPNSSLEKFITSKDQLSDNNASFDWMKLRNIITGIAKGIEYLHQGCDQRILHFDIKPHNILLDHDFNPKISDFGLAKLCSKEDSLVSMTAARGTIGYIAPEVFNGNFGTVSYKSDVYSFGMLVLEVIGARKESALTSASSDVYFPELIYKCLVQGEELDLELGDDGDAQIAKRLANIALWCIQWYPVNRPSMKAVVRMLEGPSESLIMPPNPFASTTHTEPTQQHHLAD